MSQYDIVAMGAGHNGLVAAAYLAKAGKKVLLLESKPWPGGGVVTREINTPGYWHDEHSSVHIMIQGNPMLRQEESPTLAKTDATLDAFVTNYVKTADANDVLYAVEASLDYDPGPGLGRIQAPLLAVNSADDLINPPELGILEREIKRVPKGRAVLLPLSSRTRGHGSHTVAALWSDQLAELLKQSESR